MSTSFGEYPSVASCAVSVSSSPMWNPGEAIVEVPREPIGEVRVVGDRGAILSRVEQDESVGMLDDAHEPLHKLVATRLSGSWVREPVNP